MGVAIALALLNGALIGLSRVLNGALGAREGVIHASLWNHAVGFALLSFLTLFAPHSSLHWAGAPLWAWLGGLLGVVFVASNSYVIVRIGAARTAGLVVGGQMLAAVMIANLGAPIDRAAFVGLLGAAAVIAGVVLAYKS